MSLNVGILGHVDSGKTTLTRAIAEMASTNAFDKHADKGGRRNTLDLGLVCLVLFIFYSFFALDFHVALLGGDD